MALITPLEIFDIIVMAVAIGYIFSSFIKREPLEGYDPLKFYKKSPLVENIKSAALIAAPAVILHELAHKFVAIAFGAQATLHAPYTMYAIVIMLKLINFPIMFFVGGYVTHTPLPALQSSIVSIAGPLTNLFLWIALILVTHLKLVNKKYYKIIVPMGKLNILLFIFNMLPIPGFDGYWFFRSLFSYLF